MLHECREGCTKDLTWKETKAGLQRCETHGLTLAYAKPMKGGSEEIGKPGGAGKRPRQSLKRTQPKRDWSDARAKVEEEGVCRVCSGNQDVQSAHVIGRASDGPNIGRSQAALWVNPDSIVPLCGQFSPMKCHVLYDEHALDVLEFLTPDEQVQAVKDAGSIEAARRRTSPSSYRILPESPPRPERVVG